MTHDDELTAELLALALSGRADPLVDLALAGSPAGVSSELRHVREGLAALAVTAPPVSPSTDLVSRIESTLAARRGGARRAVLVIDMLNDHLRPGGPLEVPRARAIVPALSARLDAARLAGVPVVYALDEHEPGDTDLDAWGAHNVRGTPGAEVWPDLAPHAGDRIVRKPTYSAFSRSPLEGVLDELGVDTLVLTGCLTEVGIYATATDALQRGYALEIPEDCQAGAAEAHERVTMGVLALLHPYGPARDALLARRERAAVA